MAQGESPKPAVQAIVEEKNPCAGVPRQTLGQNRDLGLNASWQTDRAVEQQSSTEPRDSSIPTKLTSRGPCKPANHKLGNHQKTVCGKGLLVRILLCKALSSGMPAEAFDVLSVLGFCGL